MPHALPCNGVTRESGTFRIQLQSLHPLLGLRLVAIRPEYWRPSNPFISNATLRALRRTIAQSEWLSTRPFAARVANLGDTGTGPRFNGDHFLLSGSTVLNDASVDFLFGDADLDWFLYDFSTDLTFDLNGGEVTTDL